MPALVQAGWESYSQACQHAAESKDDPVQFLYFQKNPELLLWVVSHPFCVHTKCCAVKTHSVLEFCGVLGRKQCLSPQEEEYVTLHGAHLDKNKYSYLERNFKSCKFYVASHGPTEPSSTGWALWGNFRQGLLTRGQNKRTFFVRTTETSL